MKHLLLPALLVCCVGQPVASIQQSFPLPTDQSLLNAEGPIRIVVERVISKNGKAAIDETTGSFFALTCSESRTTPGVALYDVLVRNTTGTDASANIYCEYRPTVREWNWSEDLDATWPAANKPHSQSQYPISVLRDLGETSCVAIAIAPDTPCVFESGWNAKHRAYVRAQVGFSDLTQPPSQSHVQFVVFTADPQWPMRSALKHYYDLFPASYERTATRDGLWIFHGKATVTPDPTFFTYHCLGELGECRILNKTATAILTPEERQKEKDWGIEMLPYVIPGQREVGFLQNLKDGYHGGEVFDDGQVQDLTDIDYSSSEALALLDSVTTANFTISQAIQSPKDFAASVKNSYLTDPNGKVVTRPRITKWSDKSVTFPTNPNPFITGHDQGLNVGSAILKQCTEWYSIGLWDGIYVDSLYRWGMYYNYREEHFAAARYGLSYGPDGRPCLWNGLEHLVFLDELRNMVHHRGGTVMANGVREICFFHAHRLDVLGSEFGSGTTLQGMANRRAISYHKPYLGMNHGQGRHVAKDRDYLARCFLFGLYGGGEVSFYTSDCYDQERDFYQTWLPVQRRLTAAGWEPVTAARSTDPGVRVERFGNGSEVFFSLYATDARVTTASVNLDLKRLGVTRIPKAFTLGKEGALQVTPDAAGHLAIREIPLSRDHIAAILLTD